MKIVGWINDPFSAILALAVVQVEPDEIADIEQMIILLDGDSVGHFGMKAELIGTDGFDVQKYLKVCHASKTGTYWGTQFGYPPTNNLRKGIRYYRAHLSRD